MNPEDVARELLARRIALTGFLRSFVRERATAEDLFQDLAVRAVAEAGDFNDAEHLGRWARKAGKHRAIDHLRRAENRRRVFDADVIDLLASEADEVASSMDDRDRARSEALEECIEKLAPQSREVIRLRYGQELSGQEVAHRLGRKDDTVYKMLARSYAQLRHCIEAKLRRGGGIA